MFLLDTNILGQARKSKPNTVLRTWFREQSAISIPFPVILEIQRGIIDVGRRDPAKAAELSDWLASILESDFQYPALTTDVARKLAELHCCPPLKCLWYVNGSKEKKPGQDLFIAAISIVHGLPIATLDGKDFARIDTYFPLPGVYHPVFRTWIVPLPEERDEATTKHRITG